MELLAPTLDAASTRGIEVLSIPAAARRLKVPTSVIWRLIGIGQLTALLDRGEHVVPVGSVRALRQDAAARRQIAADVA